jgi:hypothetical protein
MDRVTNGAMIAVLQRASLPNTNDRAMDVGTPGALHAIMVDVTFDTGIWQSTFCYVAES